MQPSDGIRGTGGTDLRPRVSVLLATHDRAYLLPRAVNSVLSQTFKGLELIVVDDCSDDATQVVLSRLDDHRVRIVRHSENKGQASAFNTALALARGEYVGFMDDDDEWLPTKLDRQLDALDSAPPRVAMAYCDSVTVDDHTGQSLYDPRPHVSGDMLPYMMATGEVLAPMITWLVRTSVAREADGFDPQVPWPVESPFFLPIARRYSVVHVQELLVRIHVNHGSQRITGQPPRGFLDYLNDHFKTHREEIEALRRRVDLPNQARLESYTYRRKARFELGFGMLPAGLRSLWRAWMIDPSATSKAVLRNAPRLIRKALRLKWTVA